MIGLDVPYVNLFFHKECYLQNVSDINAYLSQKIKECYNYKVAMETDKKGRK